MSKITTDKLPAEIDILKSDIEKRIKEFNKQTELQISGVLIEGVMTKESFNGRALISGYNIVVNIEL